jgi:hypothetical protein
LVDGKWTPTGKTNDVVHQYRWFGKGKFLQLSGTTNGEKDDGITVIGIDPATNKLTWWGFGDQGLGKFTMTLEKEGEWILAGEFTTPDGDKIVWKSKAVRVGQDEVRLTPVESSLNSVKQDAPVDVSIWTRHRE